MNGRQGKLEAGQKYVSKAGEWHTFWNDPTTGEDMEVHITVCGGDNPGFDEIFVHNFCQFGLQPLILPAFALTARHPCAHRRLPLGQDDGRTGAQPFPDVAVHVVC